MTTISSSQNPLIKQVRRLAQRKYRTREGRFVVEGIRPVLAALESGWPVEHLLVCADRLHSEVALTAVADAEARGISVVHITPGILDQIASWERPVGLLALVTSQISALDQWTVTGPGIFLAIESPGDPGNLGTILRTLDAMAGSGLILVNGGTDPFHPGAVRSSMGALFTMPLAQAADITALSAWAHRENLPIWATSAKATDNYWDAPWPDRLILLMGNEQRGLTDAVLAQADVGLKIPMWGDATSLNLAIASSLLLYEFRRQSR